MDMLPRGVSRLPVINSIAHRLHDVEVSPVAGQVVGIDRKPVEMGAPVRMRRGLVIGREDRLKADFSALDEFGHGSLSVDHDLARLRGCGFRSHR